MRCPGNGDLECRKLFRLKIGLTLIKNLADIVLQLFLLGSIYIIIVQGESKFIVELYWARFDLTS